MKKTLIIAIVAVMALTSVLLVACNENADSYDYTKAVRIDAEGNQSAEGTYMLFGSYPQSRVTDGSLSSSLTSSAGDLPTAEDAKGWTSYGYYAEGALSEYMWYIDVTHGGERYRGVYFTSYRPAHATDIGSVTTSYQDDYGYRISDADHANVYWFKFESLKWRILSEGNGQALLLCESVIDSQNYFISAATEARVIDEQPISDNNYKYSTIRAWLNDAFYNTAFGDAQKEMIVETTVDNGALSTNSAAAPWNEGANVYASQNTQDKIFLLSEREVTNADYGFQADRDAQDGARTKKTTDYAKAQGVWASKTAGRIGAANWLLRSPHCETGDSVRFVSITGIAGGNASARSAEFGIVPAVKISL